VLEEAVLAWDSELWRGLQWSGVQDRVGPDVPSVARVVLATVMGVAPVGLDGGPPRTIGVMQVLAEGATQHRCPDDRCACRGGAFERFQALRGGTAGNAATAAGAGLCVDARREAIRVNRG
jgi:hypothetical protein